MYKIVLMYHALAERNDIWKSDEFNDKKYTIYKDIFKKQIAAIKDREDIIITFDDGHQSNYNIAFPILKENNLRAIFFIISDNINKKNFLTKNQIIEMKKYGMIFGTHGKSHKHFTEIEDLKSEIQISKQILENIINDQVWCVSCPGGFCNNKIIKYLQNEKLKTVFVSKREFWNGTNCIVPRIVIMKSTKEKEFKNIINKNMMLLKRYAIIDYIKMKFKRFVNFDNVYIKKILYLVNGG